MKLTYNFDCIHKVADCICEQLKKHGIDCAKKAQDVPDKFIVEEITIKVPKRPSICNKQDQELDEIKIFISEYENSWNEDEKTITIGIKNETAFRELLEHELYHAYDNISSNDDLSNKAAGIIGPLVNAHDNPDIFLEKNKSNNYIQTLHMLYLSELGEAGAKLQGYSYRFRNFTSIEDISDFKKEIRTVTMLQMEKFEINTSSWTDEQKKEFENTIEKPIKDIQARINGMGSEYKCGIDELEKRGKEWIKENIER